MFTQRRVTLASQQRLFTPNMGTVAAFFRGEKRSSSNRVKHNNRFPKITAIAVAACVGILVTSVAMGQGRGGRPGGGGPGGAGGNKDRSASEYYRGTAMPTPATLTIHGGQYLRSDTKQFEYIIMPQQVRIYVYDKELHPISARDVQAHLSLQLPGENRTRKVSFQYVAPPGESDEQDHLIASLDASLLPEKDMPATFVFLGVAQKRDATTSFTPLISRADVRPYVMRVQYTKADIPKAARQHVCPVTGTVLDPNAQVVKVLVAECPVYLSREDDVAEVRATPEKYLAKLQSAGGSVR